MTAAKRSGLPLALAALALAACSPQAPKGVVKEDLDDAVSRAIGDPNSCLMIAEAATGKVVYRYNTHTACANTWPACEGAGTRTVAELLTLTVKDRRISSCVDPLANCLFDDAGQHVRRDRLGLGRRLTVKPAPICGLWRCGR